MENFMKLTLNDLVGTPRQIKQERRGFIGGSDARIIMSPNEAALIRLWKEKRGEAEPGDLSGNLVVQPSLPRSSTGLGTNGILDGVSRTFNAGCSIR
jgi:hypothetical protein